MRLSGQLHPAMRPAAGDRLDAALHHLLHVRVGLLAGEAMDCDRSAGPDEVHINPGTVTSSGKFSMASTSSSIRHTSVWRLASLA